MMLDFQCQGCGEHEEMFFHPSESANARPVCPECGNLMTKIHVGAPNLGWVRGLDFYNDKKLEGASEEGHWVTRTRSTRNKDGSPEREYITSRAQQLRYVKEEKLVDPADATKVEGTPSGLRPGIK